MRNKALYLVVFTVLLTAGAAGLSALTVDEAHDILNKIDKSRNFTSTDFSAVMTMISEDPEKGVEKMKVQQFRRDDKDMFLMLFLEPESKKGQGYLRVDDNLWFYDPESRKFNHTSMKDSFGGTDAKHSDFRVLSLAEDYKVNTITEGKLGKFSVYILDLEALNDEVTYPKEKLWITKDSKLVLKSEDYSGTGRLMRTSLYPKYAKVSGKYIPTVMIFIDDLIEGKKTQISMTNISTKTLPDTIFTKSYVERVNR